jgi:hypothetical protein
MARLPQRAAFGVVVLVIAVAVLGFLVSRHSVSGMGISGVTALAAMLACAVGVMLSPVMPKVSLVREEGHPYRGGPARPAARGTSMRATAVLVLACMVFTAIAVPFALHLPRWIEIEGVLGGWWLSWAAVLTVLAYRSRPLEDDGATLWSHVKAEAPRVETSADEREPSPWWHLVELGELGGIGELGTILVVVLVAIVAALVAAWLVVELVAPALFFVAYLGLQRALGCAIRASNDRGDLERSLIHGMTWATAYVVPLGGLVALVHALAGLR